MTTQTMVPCAACHAPYDAAVAPTHCPACKAIVPPHPSASAFSRLGLVPPRFVVDDKAVETMWLQRSRTVHPDRFAQKSPAERRCAAEQTAALNDAWRALRDPFDRAVALVKLAGLGEPPLPSSSLMDLMEAREEAEGSVTAKARIVAERTALFASVMQGVAEELRVVDGVPDGYTTSTAERARLQRVAAALAKARTLARLVDDLGGAKLIATLPAR